MCVNDSDITKKEKKKKKQLDTNLYIRNQGVQWSFWMKFGNKNDNDLCTYAIMVSLHK